MKELQGNEVVGVSAIQIQLASVSESSGGGSETSSPLLRLDPGMAIWTWLVFFILLGLLTKFGWKPILKALRDREEKINNALSESDRLEKFNLQANQKADALVQKAENESHKIIENTKKSAAELFTQLESEANAHAEKIVQEARLQIEQERQTVQEILQQESVAISIQIASKLVSKHLDKEAEKKLIEESLQNFK